MFSIADQKFELESYSFSPCVSIGQNGWHVSWCLGFQAKNRKIDELSWKPNVRPHYFSSLVQRLEDLNNLKITLPDRDAEDNEPLFLLYVFEHEAIRNIELTFGEWQNNEIDFSFSGISNVYASEKYGVDLPIKIELKLKYEGITVSEGEVSWAIKKFSNFFNPEKFHPPESLGKGCGFIFRPLNQNS